MADNLKWIKTHCARMDHGGCRVRVGVQDGRIVKIQADPEGWLNQGYICPKGRASHRRLTHPDRLRQPLKRTGPRGAGQWADISWPEALKTIGRHLAALRDRHGARSVAFCQGMPKGMEHFALIRLANLFGSPNVVAIQDVCHAPREITGLHTCGFYPVTDFHHPSELVMLWGSNLPATNEEGTIHRLLDLQIKNGTQTIVVDPKRTPWAERADHWLQLRPGSDAALALAFLNVIITEERFDTAFVNRWTHGFPELARHAAAFTPEKTAAVTWVAPEQLRQAARAYGEASPAALQWGNSIEATVNAFDAARALVNLMAICGNLDIPGGNLHALEPPVLPAGKFVCARRIPDKPQSMLNASHGTMPRMMTVPPAHFREAVLKEKPYPVKGAYIQCANPLLAAADSRQTHAALNRLDFLAVADITMTPTAALADIVLPAATHFEFDDIGHYGMGHGYILARPKVVEPPKDCRPDMQILNDLGKLLTDPEDWFDHWEEMLAELLAPAGLTFDQFAKIGHLKGPDRFKKYEASGFRTPTGKVELELSRATQLGAAPFPCYPAEEITLSPEYPLVLTSAKDPYYLHSCYRWIDDLRRRSPRPRVEIHPRTAAAHEICEGDAVGIETPYSTITQTARLTDRVAPNVIFAAYGWWFATESRTQGGPDWQTSNFNMLTASAPLGQAFGTPNIKGLACRIRRL